MVSVKSTMNEILLKKQAQWRSDFPILATKMPGDKPLAFLDNAATTQKLRCVLAAEQDFYLHHNANIHRGIYTLSERASHAYELARKTVANFIGAQTATEVVFVRGTTEGINLVANAFLAPRLQADDEIVLTVMEHHSNIVPWQILAQNVGAHLRVVDIDADGQIDEQQFVSLLGSRTKMVAFTHASNVLGTVLPVKRLIAHARAQSIPVLVDAAQVVAHMPVDVVDLDADFYVFSGHKLFAATGIGVLYAKSEHLDEMGVYQTGGSMIEQVSFRSTSFAKAPARFEAGTPHIAGAIALAAACDYILEIGFSDIMAYEQFLYEQLLDVLADFPRLKIYGHAVDKIAIASFVHQGAHAHDIATILDSEGVAVRAGHHCAMPLAEYLGVVSTSRVSLAMYNNLADLAALRRGLEKIEALF